MAIMLIGCSFFLLFLPHDLNPSELQPLGAGKVQGIDMIDNSFSIACLSSLPQQH